MYTLMLFVQIAPLHKIHVANTNDCPEVVFLVGVQGPWLIASYYHNLGLIITGVNVIMAFIMQSIPLSSLLLASVFL